MSERGTSWVTMGKNAAVARSSVAVFGSGNVGSDLLIKLSRSRTLSIEAVIGRRPDSPGVLLAKEQGLRVSASGLEGLDKTLSSGSVDWVIDASSTVANASVLEIARAHDVRVLDLTPSVESTPFLPGFTDIKGLSGKDHIGLVSCGAQASFPVLTALAHLGEIKRVELTSSLASASVGPGTRVNLDAYIDKTSDALLRIARESKVILIVNPADPPIEMSVTLFVQFEDNSVTPATLSDALDRRWAEILKLIPGIVLVGIPTRTADHIQLSFKVTGAGDYLPKYAGNLDVITRAAVNFLEEFSGRVGIGD